MSKSILTGGAATNQPLSLIYIPGWKLNAGNDDLAFTDTWQAVLDQVQGLIEQTDPLSGAGVLTAAVSSNPDIEPKVVVQELEGLIHSPLEAGLNVGVVGHSIGGYYAAYIAAKYHLPVVLINPLVKAYSSLLLADMLEDKPDLMALAKTQLKELELPCQADRTMLMLQRGDLLQDYQQALESYNDCNQIVLNGGHYSFHNLQDWLVPVTGFVSRYYDH